MKLYSHIFLGVFFFGIISSIISQNKKTDSLERKLLIETIDTNRIKILANLFWITRHQQLDKALKYSKECVNQANKLDISTNPSKRLAFMKADAFLNYGIALTGIAQFDQSIEATKKALDIAAKFQLKKQESICYNNLGEINRLKGDYKIAIEYFLKSLKIKEEAGDKKGMGYTYNNIANTYAGLNRHKEAMVNFEKALALREAIGHKKGMADTYSNMGTSLIVLGQDQKALKYYNKSIALQRELGDSIGVANDLDNIGSYYEKKGNNKLALRYYQQAEKIYTQSQDEHTLGYAKISIANSYALQGNEKEAIYYAKQAIELGKKLNLNRELQDWYNILSSIEEKFNHYKEALDAKNLSVLYNDSIINETNNQSISNLKAFYESEKQDEQIKTQSAELKVKQEEVKTQKLQKIYLLGILIAMIVFGAFVVRSYRQKKQANKLLAAQNFEINEKKNIIEEKHKEITDSINYAERIQRSFLATKELLNDNLKDYFVFFQPKDIVSGDFYWATTLSNGNFAMITADSTGHGVPGAIMSILNISCLENAVKEGNAEPSEILDHTRINIIERLKKDGSTEGGKDGMDCSVCVFDFENKKLFVAAANNPVWIVRRVTSSSDEGAYREVKTDNSSRYEQSSTRTDNIEVIEIKPDKMPVGKHDKDSVSFTQQKIDLQKGDVIYTLTDGFPDQFGGEKGKKFMSKNLRELLAANSHLPMHEQKQILEKTFTDWKGNIEQVDDVTLIGVRIL